MHYYIMDGCRLQAGIVRMFPAVYGQRESR